MRKQSIKLVEEFEAATRREAWAGAQPPEERSEIRFNFRITKHDLEEYIHSLRGTIAELHSNGSRLKRGKKV